jgi:hypothetical protein
VTGVPGSTRSQRVDAEAPPGSANVNALTVHPIDFYDVDGYQVWGLTAAMLRHFFLRCGLT